MTSKIGDVVRYVDSNQPGRYAGYGIVTRVDEHDRKVDFNGYEASGHSSVFEVVQRAGFTEEELEASVVLSVMHGAQCVLNNLRDEECFFGGGLSIHVGFGPQDKAAGIAIASAYGAISLVYTGYLRPA